MSKFSKGDKVRVFKGRLEGKSGVVTDPAWQVSQSDWPRVEFITEDGLFYFYAEEEEMELTEDPYEYAILRTRLRLAGGHPDIVGEHWGPRDEVNMGLLNLTTEIFEYKLVKRRKAGAIEDA